MKEKGLKGFVKTTQGKLILVCCAVLVVCWGFMLVQFAGGFSSLFPSEEKIKDLKQDVRKLRALAEEHRKTAAKYDLQKKLYREKLVTYWNEERDGLVDTVLRNTIQNTAKEMELTLSSLGSVRITRINNELYFAEVDNLSAAASYEALIKFLAKLEAIRPALHWRRLDLRPEPVRPGGPQQRGSNSSQTAALTPAATRMRLYGAVRVIGYDGKLPLSEIRKSLGSSAKGSSGTKNAVPGKANGSSPAPSPAQNGVEKEEKKGENIPEKIPLPKPPLVPEKPAEKKEEKAPAQGALSKPADAPAGTAETKDGKKTGNAPAPGKTPAQGGAK